MTECPCTQCDAWNTKVFPNCRSNCNAADEYVSQFSFNPIYDEFIILPYDMNLEEEEDNMYF